MLKPERLKPLETERQKWAHHYKSHRNRVLTLQLWLAQWALENDLRSNLWFERLDTTKFGPAISTAELEGTTI